MPRYPFAMAICLCASLSLSLAHADLENPGFETGDFNGWSIAGAASVYSALDDFSVLVEPDSNFAASLVVAQQGTIGSSNLEIFLGIPADSFNLGGSISGTGIKQTFTLDQPTHIQFYWVFAIFQFAEGPLPPSSDSAWYVLDGVLNQIADLSTPLPNSTDLLPSPLHLTNFNLLDLGILPAGQHTLGFGIIGTALDPLFSLLVIDNQGGTVIPEPASAALLTLTGLGLLARRRC